MKYCYHCMSPKDGAVCATCNKADPESVPAHRLQPGTILNGRFMIGTALGEGGCGITYIGRDTNLDIKVAIKEFYPNGFANRNNTVSMEVTHNTEEKKNFFEKGRKDFLKEARILAKFSGEAGIVDVRDHFEANNTAYIVMEYLEGTDLRGYLRQKGKLSPEETINLLLPVIRSLEKIHKDGLIHRDISPDNIRIVGGMVKLIDFGAARDIASVTNKNSLSVMLKPGYAPMEQYSRKGKQGSWTDVYGLCATIYKCITGITPEDATDRIQADELKKPSELGCNITPTFEKALLKGLSVSVENRIKTVSELMDAIDGKTEISDTDEEEATVLRSEKDRTAFIIPTEIHSPNDVPAVYTKNVANTKRKKKRKSRNKKVLIAIACAMVFVLLLTTVMPKVLSGKSVTAQEQTTTEKATTESVQNIYVINTPETENITSTIPETTSATQTTEQTTTVPITTIPVTTTATPVTTTTQQNTEEYYTEEYYEEYEEDYYPPETTRKSIQETLSEWIDHADWDDLTKDRSDKDENDKKYDQDNQIEYTSETYTMPSTKSEIVDFYKTAVSDIKYNGSAGYSKKTWQSIHPIDIGASMINTTIEDVLADFIYTENEAVEQTANKNSNDTKLFFHAYTLSNDSYISKATCTTNYTGNYIINIQFRDGLTEYEINQIMNPLLTMNELEDILNKDPNIHKIVDSYNGASLSFNNVQIQAMITPNGQFVSLQQSHDTEIHFDNINVLIATLKNKSIVISNTCQFYNFEY